MAVCESLGKLGLGLERLEQEAADPPLGRTRLKRFAIVAVAADDESDVQAPLLDALGEVEQLIQTLLAADVAAVERGEGTGALGQGTYQGVVDRGRDDVDRGLDPDGADRVDHALREGDDAVHAIQGLSLQPGDEARQHGDAGHLERLGQTGLQVVDDGEMTRDARRAEHAGGDREDGRADRDESIGAGHAQQRPPGTQGEMAFGRQAGHEAAAGFVGGDRDAPDGDALVGLAVACAVALGAACDRAFMLATD